MIYHLVENFCVYLQAKTQLHPSCFNGDIAKICKLILGTLGMPGYTHQKWWYHLAEDFDDIYLFICMQKINFIIHFFLMILHFKKSCNLIGLQHFWPITRDPKFCQICCWNIKNNISFHFRLFPRKLRW